MRNGYTLIFILWIVVGITALISFFFARPPFTQTQTKLLENALQVEELYTTYATAAFRSREQNIEMDNRWSSVKILGAQSAGTDIQGELNVLLEALRQSGIEISLDKILSPQAGRQAGAPRTGSEKNRLQPAFPPRRMEYTLTSQGQVLMVRSRTADALPSAYHAPADMQIRYLTALGLSTSNARRLTLDLRDHSRRLENVEQAMDFHWSGLSDTRELSAADLRFLKKHFNVSSRVPTLNISMADAETVALFADISLDKAEKLKAMAAGPGITLNAPILKDVLGLRDAGRLEKILTNRSMDNEAILLTLESTSGPSITGVFDSRTNQLLEAYQQ